VATVLGSSQTAAVLSLQNELKLSPTCQCIELHSPAAAPAAESNTQGHAHACKASEKCTHNTGASCSTSSSTHSLAAAPWGIKAQDTPHAQVSGLLPLPHQPATRHGVLKTAAPLQHGKHSYTTATAAGLQHKKVKALLQSPGCPTPGSADKTKWQRCSKPAQDR
jgi:hypothetical protein